MRCTYREAVYECGDYLESCIYPVYKASTTRRRKSKPTSEAIQRLNDLHSQNNMIRIVNANFTESDYKLDLTYATEHHPESDEAAERELKNYLRRLKHWRKKNGLPALKYVAVTEKGKKLGRFHHHLIVNDMPAKVLKEMWTNGRSQTDLLQFDENGCADLVRYMMKQAREVFGKPKYSRSRNLVIPQPKKRDGRISKKKAVELAKDTECRAEFEKLYEGYFLAEASAFFNDDNGGVYLHMRFYKKEAAFCTRKKKTNRSHFSAGQSTQNNNTRNLR